MYTARYNTTLEICIYVTIHNHLQHPASAIAMVMWTVAPCMMCAARASLEQRELLVHRIWINALKVMLHIAVTYVHARDCSCASIGKQVLAYFLFRKDASWKRKSSVVLLVPRDTLYFVDVSSATSGDSDASLGCWPRRYALFRDLSTACSASLVPWSFLAAHVVELDGAPLLAVVD